MITPAELWFFEQKPAVLPIYEAFRAAVLQAVPEARIDVKKTQISFFVKHMFAAVSFQPSRRKKERPEPYLTVTFGLRYRVESARIAAVSEPYPHRWTHHVLLGSPQEADDELLAWITAAADSAGREQSI
ncbi:MAG: hypothetical protein IJH44_03790 [Solobacterium sp.]|nr:hypothetical protein [Solobacterium sp.]